MTAIARTSCLLVLGMLVLGCDAVKPREPKQAQDPTLRSPKYGNIQVDIEPDGGSAEPAK
jgi:hypothetical protein